MGQITALPPLTPELKAELERAARCDLPVLLEGETGTGKTYLATVIHRLSDRARGPFIEQNCGALPPTLIEAELFGRERGAYTDARDSAAGLVEMANRGTLLLDEIGELAPPDQVKLLSVLEKRSVRRVGGRREIPVDVRFLFATNRDLFAAVDQALFRSDLYYRCCGVRVRVPPLRVRPDFEAVVLHVLANVLEELKGESSDVLIDEEAAAVLRAYSWPGNIRELRHVLTQAVISRRSGRITRKDLPAELHRPRVPADRHSTRRRRYTAPSSAKEERAIIVDALRRARGNKTRAAEIIGLSRSTLWERLHRYGITERDWQTDV
jgi:transcriptional regulator with PAS, ATPase and Fis domain